MLGENKPASSAGEASTTRARSRRVTPVTSPTLVITTDPSAASARASVKRPGSGPAENASV